MPQKTEMRAPEEIIQDLLLYIRYLELISDTPAASPDDEAGAVTVEAKAYLEKRAEDKATWERILNDPFFKTAPLVDILPHVPASDWRDRRVSYDSGL